jgi:hypothetical protein
MKNGRPIAPKCESFASANLFSKVSDDNVPRLRHLEKHLPISGRHPLRKSEAFVAITPKISELPGSRQRFQGEAQLFIKDYSDAIFVAPDHRAWRAPALTVNDEIEAVWHRSEPL